MEALVLLAAVIGTSTLSGVFGMAGGMVLMAVYLAVLPIPDAMVLHGVTQLAANGFRCVLLGRHIDLRVVGFLTLGALAAAAVLAAFAVVLSRPAIMILLGVVPLAGALLPRTLLPRGVDDPRVAVGCGAVATTAQLTAGVAGPLLDLFFVSSRLDRFGVIATKSAVGALGHLLKLVYFGGLVADGGGGVPPWMYAAAAACALVGTRIGRAILAHVSEARFRTASRGLVLALSCLLAVRGLAEAL